MINAGPVPTLVVAAHAHFRVHRSAELVRRYEQALLSVVPAAAAVSGASAVLHAGRANNEIMQGTPPSLLAGKREVRLDVDAAAYAAGKESAQPLHLLLVVADSGGCQCPSEIADWKAAKPAGISAPQ